MCYDEKMQIPRSFTTITPISKALAMGLFVTFPFLGFWLGINYQNAICQQKQNINTQNSSSIHSPQKKVTTSPPKYVDKKEFDQLIWKKYSNSSQGISFEYPDNLNHFEEQLGGTRSSALKIENEKLTLSTGMSYIFQIEKITTNDSVESWWNKNDASKNNGTGLMPAKMTKTAFHNKTAYYFETLKAQQIPTDFYIVPFNGYFLKISFSKIAPYRDALYSCINSGSCSSSDLYSTIYNDNTYRQVDDLIIQRILSSITFNQ